MKVQIRPCQLFGGRVHECSTEEAEFYGVYQGEPGDLMWTADFNCHSDARNWAEELAANEECSLEDLCEF